MMFDALLDAIPTVRNILARVAPGGGAPFVIGTAHIHALDVPADVAGPAMIHITDALESGLVTADELKPPEVARLLFRHTGGGGEPVFVPAGTLVRRGGQNRIVSLSTLLAPGDARPIEVRCVEVGRWNPTRSGSSTETGSAPQSLKSRKLSRDLSARMRVDGRPAEDQDETWRDVAQHLATMSMRSPTGSLFDAIDRSPASTVAIPETFAGAAGAWFDGETSGGEVFLSVGLRRAGLRGLVQSAASDGERHRRPAVSFVDARADLLSSAAWRATPVPGGTIVDFRDERSEAVGSDFVAEGRVVHLVIAVQ